MTYLVEYETDEGLVTQRFQTRRPAERAARRASRKYPTIVYVIAETETDRVGQRTFYQGRTDTIEGEYVQ